MKPARLMRPNPKVFVELTGKGFGFILNLGCHMIQHASGAPGSHFASVMTCLKMKPLQRVAELRGEEHF